MSWSSTAQFRMPVATWRAMIAEHYPGGGWIRVSDETLAALNDRRGARGLPSFDACIDELLERRGTAMREQLEELVASLLYEGYALYPYTPDATKNATPTPFGIVYPPAYAAECAGAFDHARLECVAEPARRRDADRDAALPDAQRASGHEASERRVELGPVAIGERVSVELPGGRFTLRSEPLDEPGRALVRACVHNTADVPAGLDRAAALRASLISIHVVVEISAGRFVSPLEAGRESVNIWPVLATPDDDAVLGAGDRAARPPADRAEHSHGNLFDNTEIEEALVLHVHALTDAEREAAAEPRPGRRRDARARAGARPAGDHGAAQRPDARWLAAGADHVPSVEDVRGEERATVDGVTFERGATLVLRPGTDRDPYDRMLDGRRATLERIYVDYDDRVHLAVTVDDDPGQELMRETGRYLFFFANEVEPAMTETARAHQADPRRRHRQRLAARRRLRRRGGQAARPTASCRRGCT